MSLLINDYMISNTSKIYVYKLLYTIISKFYQGNFFIKS